MAAFQLARFFKVTRKLYDRQDACQSGVWMHTWHRDAKALERVVRTKHQSVAAARRAFRAWVAALEAQHYERHPSDGSTWSINPRGLRGYIQAGKKWGWPQKWGADVSVRVVKT